MNKEEIENSNKFIAEFMGGDPYHNNTPELACNDGRLYHSSWDWLMPVINKCSELDFALFDDKQFKIELWMFITNDINSIYAKVIEFIIYYNEKEQSKL